MTKKGFTLIELLVVIGIIGILAALITVSFTASQRQARDTQRKSDLSQYRSSLEAYSNKTNGLYPAHVSAVTADTLCTSDSMATTCPPDPKNGSSSPSGPTFGYRYISDASGIKYVLYGYLENVSGYWVVCSSGTSTLKSGTTTPVLASDCP